jgi:hypothetical protein
VKVAVHLTIEIDPTKWEGGEYALDARLLRDDLRRYLLHHIRGAAAFEEAGASVELRRY